MAAQGLILVQSTSRVSLVTVLSTKTLGRIFGAIVLAAFVLYGVGTSLANQTIGLTLVTANSIAVAIAGLIGWRVIKADHPRAGLGYLVGRVAEAALLVGGFALYTLNDVDGADNTGYLLGMLALAAGSVPFFHHLGNGPWIPNRLAQWGVVGYVALGVGAAIELATGWAVTLFFAVPGGLFELALGLYLVARGFVTNSARAAGQQQSEVVAVVGPELVDG